MVGQGQTENERYMLENFKARAKAHKTQQKLVLLEKELETLCLSFPSTEDTVKQISEIREKLSTIHWE